MILPAVPPVIDVIIPVYRGLPATRRCIESVLASACVEAREVIVIDDASPEPEISAWLRELGQGGRVTLRVHERNLGFVASVNEAMALHEDRDVVLLNSDTEVAPGWLDRLAACARREANVATVTPFTNNGSICSYPRFASQNPLPRGMTVAQLDALFAEVNAAVAIDLPVGVGFCMYITRRAIAAVGMFDEEAFGRGYGEEVDFCMRAARAGLRNVLAADVFVYHEGEVSFGLGAPQLRESAQRVIDERYPEFQPTVREFVEREPLRASRRRIDLERLRRSSLPRLLLVTHAWHGGVERHVQDLIRLLEGHAEILTLRPAAQGRVCLEWVRGDAQLLAWFEVPRQWDACESLLRAAAIDRIHYHHVHGHPEAVLDLPRRLGVPYDVTLHDYFPLCPRYHLSRDGRTTCVRHDGTVCDRCLEEAPAQWPMNLAEWRETFHAWLRTAARVIVPSEDLAQRIGRHWPDVAMHVWPHPETPLEPRKVYKIALVGALSAIKGSAILEECLVDAVRRELPLHFHVIGHLDRTLPTWPRAPLTIAGTYPDDRLMEAIEIARPDAFLFLSQVPETYSYTLTAALATGKPIAAPRIGAFSERLEPYGRAMLFALDTSPESINDLLVARLGALSLGTARLQAVADPR